MGDLKYHKHSSIVSNKPVHEWQQTIDAEKAVNRDSGKKDQLAQLLLDQDSGQTMDEQVNQVLQSFGYCLNVNEFNNDDDRVIEVRKLEVTSTILLAETMFSETGILPTKLQQAISISALCMADVHPKQIWSFYAGMGKSYIIACTAFLAGNTASFDHVTIVIPNNNLLLRDQQRFAALFKPHICQIQYARDLTFAVKPKHLVLIDEADYLIYENSSEFFSIGANSTKIAKKAQPKIICFTSTKGNGTPLWDNLLLYHGYKELSYWPDQLAVPTSVVQSLGSTKLQEIEPSGILQMLTNY